MIFTTISYKLYNSAAIVTINRPQTHNAINETTMAELEDALDHIEADSNVHSIILTGAGEKTFCAGGDLKYFATLQTRKLVTQMSERMQAILRRLWEGPRVVVAAINGQAIGGGCEILTACHRRVAVDGAHFSFKQAANGIITGWGGGARLFRLIGTAQSLQLLLTAEQIDASEAKRIGFVDQVVVPELLLTVALELAHNTPPQKLKSIRTIRKPERNSVHAIEAFE